MRMAEPTPLHEPGYEATMNAGREELRGELLRVHQVHQVQIVRPSIELSRVPGFGELRICGRRRVFTG